MRKIFAFIVLTGLLLGNLVYSQFSQFRGGLEREIEIPERIEEKIPKVEERIPRLEEITPKIEERVSKIEEITPEFDFIFPKEEKIKGKTGIKGRVKNANSVEFYYQFPGATLPVYLGRAQPRDENFWELSWDTNLTPNGAYYIFAKIKNQYGEYESQSIKKILIENEVPKQPEKREELEKEHQKIKEEIEKIEEKAKEKEKEIKEKLDLWVERREEKEELREKLEEFTDKIKIEKQREIEIEKIEKEKGDKKEEMKKLEEELKKIQEIPKPEAKIFQTEKEVKLEVEKKEWQKIEEKIEALKEEKEKESRGKEEIKKEIIEKVKTEEKERISEKIEILEKEVKEKEKIKTEKEEVLVKDSDGDDLPDEFEIFIGTDPLNPDSEGDGFLDGTEYKLGYDPLQAGAADRVVFSDAKKAKPQKTEIYYVEKVTTVTLPTGQTGIKIEGKGLPNSFVTIYIYSAPIVMVTRTDGNGNWSIVLDKPLADGIHEVYTTVTNNHGEITARSEPFIFEKSGERIVAVTISGLLTEKAISPVQAYQLVFLILAIALVILAIGIALIIIGVSIQRRLKKEKESS